MKILVGIISCFVLLFSVRAQSKLPLDNITFDIYSDTKELFEGECTILRASVLVKSVQDVGVRFHDFSHQIVNLQKEIESHFHFFSPNAIKAINGFIVTIDDSQYVEYPILEMAVCPTERVSLPAMQLNMMKANDSSIITLKSKEISIGTREIDPDLRLYPGSPLVGEFTSRLDRNNLNVKVGDTVRVTLEVSGSGNLFHSVVPRYEDKNLLLIPSVKSFADTVNLTTYFTVKEFNIDILVKRPGEFRIDEALEISYYSPDLNRQLKTRNVLQINAIGSKDEFTYPEEHNLVVLRDASISMDLEDYSPNRLARGNIVVRKLLEFGCYPVYTITGRVSEQTGCEIESNPERTFPGTAIANGIWFATQYLVNIEHEKKGILILSDGDGTIGNTTTKHAADNARKMGIKVFTIGIGSHGRVRYGVDFFGRPRYIDDVFDELTLKELSEITDGRYYLLPKESDGRDILVEILDVLN